MKGVRPAEYHADQGEHDGGLVERLVKTQVVVRRVLEIRKAGSLVEVSIHDPVLRHIPNSNNRVIVDQKDYQQSQ